MLTVAQIADKKHHTAGFTIVELLIVVVVIAILAAVSLVGYGGIQSRARTAAMQADLRNVSTLLAASNVKDGAYPTPSLPSSATASDGNLLEYTSDGSTFCLTVSSPSVPNTAYHVTQSGGISEGACVGHFAGAISDGVLLQQITSANCPSTRTRAVDARDNHSYWIQKLSDGECWMLTNLAYAGGGDAAYGDTMTFNNTGSIYTTPQYRIPSAANVTSEPTNPSTATTGTSQYGYLYNWCGAMGGQTSTSACSTSTSPLPSTSISVCPAGWRLPSGGTVSEFANLNTAVNSGSTSSSTGLLTNWLGQKNGYWSSGFTGQGSHGDYWSSTQSSGAYAYVLYFSNSSVTPAHDGGKHGGQGVRCIAS